MEKMDEFKVIVLGVIYDPAKKKILIGRRENDPNFPKLKWCFPGGRAYHGEDVDKILKKNIKEKTGYTIKNLGAIFVTTYREKKDFLGVYFLTEVFEGKETLGVGMKELKWVNPKEIEKYFDEKLHSRLKEFLEHLS